MREVSRRFRPTLRSYPRPVCADGDHHRTHDGGVTTLRSDIRPFGERLSRQASSGHRFCAGICVGLRSLDGNC